MSGALAGVRVLVTRPAHQAEALCRMIEAEGGTAIRLPLLAIEPRANPADVKPKLAQPHDFWIFTSTNAVRYALPLLTVPLPERIAAIGAATAAALAAAGAANATVPMAGASSAALLASPELAELNGRRVLIVTGEEGLTTLEDELVARGATVTRAEVYRRIALPYPPDSVSAALRRSDVLIVTSGQALEHLLRLTPPEMRKALLKKPLVVPSARMLEKAHDLGFALPARVVDPVSDVALTAACAAP
ncbi:MAG TPA: uroporphyrinogen-III synthase [Verrucomicrobiae bacterium]|nr:uroporphyrinogen-III synthase [Verrucomicrobiae bacterium]